MDHAHNQWLRQPKGTVMDKTIFLTTPFKPSENMGNPFLSILNFLEKQVSQAAFFVIGAFPKMKMEVDQ